MLWRACLDERVVLARAWRATAAAADPSLKGDPLVALLGGADPAASPGAFGDDGLREAAPTLLAALGSALPRRGRGLPALHVALAHGAAGRALVAWLATMDFPIFALPAPAMADLRSGMQSIAAAWPDAGSIVAPPALAGLAAAHRVSPALRGAPSRSAAVDEIAAAPDPLAMLVALASGVTASLVGWRAQWMGAAREALARTVRQPGVAVDERDALVVSMPLGAIDLVLRRAGLDSDPGWVPWLGRAVRIAYRDGEESPPPPGR